VPRRLPSLAHLASDIRAIQVGRNRTVDDALTYIVDNRSALAPFDDFVDLALSLDEPTVTGTERGLAFNLDAVLDAVCRELWSREIYIGASLVAELLFDAAKQGSVVDPLRAVLDFFRDRRVARDGLIVFPLHTFGILSAGLLAGFTGARLSVVNPRAGYVLIPQTNKLSRTVEALEQARLDLAVVKPVPGDAIAHYHRSRAKWLTDNPLLVARVAHLSGSKFENQTFLMRRVRSASGLLAMLAAFQPPTTSRAARYFSTSTINNRETLDIHHYVTLANHPQIHGRLEPDIVPINADREQVYELSDLGVQLDPSYRRWRDDLFTRIEAAVEMVHRTYVETEVRGLRGGRAQLARKLFTSMDYYRRSFRRAAGSWATAVTLATAMEMLLTDGWEGLGVADRMTRRARILLRGVRGTRALQEALGDLYNVRSEFVHHGSSDAGYDLALVRQAYVRCFVGLAEAMPRVRTQSDRPVREICGS
jgi:hypothetical protein